MRTIVIALLSALLHISAAWAQTRATQDEIAKWQKNPQPLETTPCRIVTTILDNERDKERALQKIHLALGWWGRGFIEGAAYTMDLPNNDKAMKKVTEFGLTVDVVAAHLDAYCRTNPDHTPFEGVQDLLLTALK